MLLDHGGKKTDVGKQLVADGFALADRRKEQRLQDLVCVFLSFVLFMRRINTISLFFLVQIV